MDADKTMFEVYRETAYSGAFRVVYYTELHEHNKETEINRAAAGEHYIEGFLRDYRKDEAKEIISGLLDRMNSGESIPPEAFIRALDNHLA